MIEGVYARVGTALRGGRFPLIYGGDCAVLLGAVPGLRDVGGRAGLLFIDGHEDATPMEGSRSGEAANMEIALLLGLTRVPTAEALERRLPALEPEAIVMVGQRDDMYRREIGARSIADRVRLHGIEEVHGDPGGVGRAAARYLAMSARDWWLHIDLDVLDGSEFSACGAATDPSIPGGLTWTELKVLTKSALEPGGCRGWSVGVYNVDLDPDGRAANQIVAFLADATSG